MKILKNKTIWVYLILAIVFFKAGATYSNSTKQKFYLDPPAIVNSQELACKTIFSSDVYQEDVEDENAITIKTTKGITNLAIRINDETLSLITDTAVQQGFTEASEWQIIDNNTNSLTAVGMQSEIVYTFTLNKQTGFAIWTKGQPNILYIQKPSGFVSFLQCK